MLPDDRTESSSLLGRTPDGAPCLLATRTITRTDRRPVIHGRDGHSDHDWIRRCIHGDRLEEHGVDDPRTDRAGGIDSSASISEELCTRLRDQRHPRRDRGTSDCTYSGKSGCSLPCLWYCLWEYACSKLPGVWGTLEPEDPSPPRVTDIRKPLDSSSVPSIFFANVRAPMKIGVSLTEPASPLIWGAC